MKRVVLLIGVVYTFISCEKNVGWNLPRPNPNHLYNICYENNCDSLSNILVGGGWSILPSSLSFKGQALESSRSPGEYIKFSYTSTSPSSLNFWIHADNSMSGEEYTDGTLVKVYINNEEWPLYVEKRKKVENGYWPMYWWNIRTDSFPAGTWIIRIVITGIFNNTERANALKPRIDEIEIRCH